MQTVAAFFPLKWMAQGLRSVFLPDALAAQEPAGSWELGRVALVLGALVRRRAAALCRHLPLAGPRHAGLSYVRFGACTAERRERRPRPQGPAARPPGRRAAAADGARARRRARLPRAARRRRRRAWAAGSGRPRTPGSLVRYLETFAHTVGVMQQPDAIHRVARECALDLAADGVVYAEVRFAPELSTAHGLAIEAVVEAMVDGFAAGSAEAAAAGTPIRVGALLCAMRQADRWEEVAGLVVRYRDAGVVGFDLAGPEIGFPPDRVPARDRAAGPRARAPHHPRRRGRRHRQHPGRAGRRPRRAAGARRAHRRRGRRRRHARARWRSGSATSR